MHRLAPGRRTLASLLATSGALHFAHPEPFVRIVPPMIGHQRTWVYVSGAAELGCAAGLLARGRVRRAAALSTAALLVAVFPANVWMAWSAWRDRRSVAYLLATLVRLPLQVPLVAAALSVR
ncbi:putative membrane protein [Motilibacter peucedani]|uniref:Putative membrane protein n=1 Tax=Motilibacter peucedani TaxID=598650 RepID=A0A420XS01_9ACTN|nr:hypothetical protein [Motilibacter peucedani]RKS77683.1 putative membrane protein [Motilibacter peucedani]